jgi:hypothetical protein
VRFDVENQQIIIKDSKKKEVRVIDLKKSGISILSNEESKKIERTVQQNRADGNPDL